MKDIKCVYYLNRSHPGNENQSDGRNEMIDSNTLKFSLSNVRYKTLRFQLHVVVEDGQSNELQ